jgi:hypothetical protein
VSAHGEISQVKIPAEDRTTDLSAQNNFWTFLFFEDFGANSSIQLMNDNFGIRISTGKVVGFSFLVLMMSTGPSSFSCCCCRDIYYISRPPGEEDRKRLECPEEVLHPNTVVSFTEKGLQQSRQKKKKCLFKKNKKSEAFIRQLPFLFPFFFRVFGRDSWPSMT